MNNIQRARILRYHTFHGEPEIVMLHGCTCYANRRYACKHYQYGKCVLDECDFSPKRTLSPEEMRHLNDICFNEFPCPGCGTMNYIEIDNDKDAYGDMSSRIRYHCLECGLRREKADTLGYCSVEEAAEHLRLSRDVQFENGYAIIEEHPYDKQPLTDWDEVLREYREKRTKGAK